jgi:hypothetical protein
MPVLAGAGFLLVLFAALWVAARWLAGNSDEVDIKLGTDTFDELVAERAAPKIAADGPLLYQDLLVGGDRDIYVSHVGDDPERGWFAFLARADGSERRCTVVWDRARQLLVDPCTTTTYPPTGEGLVQFPVGVNIEGKVVVDLTPDGDPGEGTSTSTVSG